MKKVIVPILVIMMTAGLSSFANLNTQPDKQVLDQFKKEFATAENVSWDKQDEFDKATFVLAGRRVIAYYNSNAQLEGCIRDIFFDQLPLAVMTAVDKRFPQAEIMDVREITNSEGTNYRITVESKKRKFRVKVSANGGINDIEKLTK